MTTPHTDAAPLGVERTAPDVIPGLAALAQAIDRDGVRSLDDALAMGAAIVDPNTGDVEWLMAHGCDVIERLAAEVRRTAAHAAGEAERTAAAVAAERERCARVCEVVSMELSSDFRLRQGMHAAVRCAKAIAAPTGGAQ